MNKNVVIILIGAILTAFVVAFGVQAMFKPEAAPEGVQIQTVQILVAAEKLTEGEIIETGKLKWQEWPQSAVIPGVYTQKDGVPIAEMAVVGHPVRRDVALGEPLLSSAVIIDADANFLAATIEPGMLAYSIPVSPSSSVGGFARPGDYVDVILTHSVRVSSDQREEASAVVRSHVSETILQNARVLAVDQTAHEADREIKVGKVVTLEVSQKGAEVLALALEMGEISLALRRLGSVDTEKPDGDSAPTTDVAISKTLQKLNRLQRSSDGYGEEGASGHSGTATIRVYRGNESERVTVPLAR